jgi:hypothetical protein
MNRKIFFVASIAIALCLILTGLSYSEQQVIDQSGQGAVVKLPYPIVKQNLCLENQKVKIMLYSNFIEVDSEYQIKNPEPEEVTATIGFPVYLHSLDMSKGESEPVDLRVSQGKRDDIFVRTKDEGTVDFKKDSSFKRWYYWDVDIAGNRYTKFRVQYYLKLNRENGIPHLTYELGKVNTFTGNVKQTEITVNMPMDCEKIPFVSDKFATNDSYIYSSLPKPIVRKNILTWSSDKNKLDKDLELYFYANGYPDWEVKCSEDNFPEKSFNIIDGNIRTFWKAKGSRDGQGAWMEFKPVVRTRDGKTRSYSPKVSGIGIVPGNIRTLSDFYNFSQLREADGEIFIEPESEKPSQKTTKDGKTGSSPYATGIVPEPVKKNKTSRTNKRDKQDYIFLDCNADPIMQVFKPRTPLDTRQGPVRVTAVSVYSGQRFKELCISEVLLFDRSDKNTLNQW